MPLPVQPSVGSFDVSAAEQQLAWQEQRAAQAGSDEDRKRADTAAAHWREIIKRLRNEDKQTDADAEARSVRMEAAKQRARASEAETHSRALEQLDLRRVERLEAAKQRAKQREVETHGAVLARVAEWKEDKARQRRVGEGASGDKEEEDRKVREFYLNARKQQEKAASRAEALAARQQEQAQKLADRAARQTDRAKAASQKQADRDYAASPQGRTEAAHEQRRASTAAAEWRAKDARTPAGTARLREEGQLDRRKGAAEEAVARQRNVADYGRVGGALINFKNDTMKAVGAMSPYIAAAKQAAAVVGDFVQAASPSTMKTFNDSIGILQAKLGKQFIPVVDDASKSLQDWAAIADKNPKAASALGDAAKWLIGVPIKGTLDAAAGRSDKDFKRDFDDRLQSRFTSFEQYGQSLTTSGLQAGSQEAENEWRQAQLKYLAENGQLLTEIKENTKGMKNAQPMFS